jgi:polysaccharide biosynthesis transport protein
MKNDIENSKSYLFTEDELDINEIWRIIRSYKSHIIIIIALVMIMAIYTTLTTRPIFQATTVLMIKESRSDPSSFVFDFGKSGYLQGLKNEIEVLKSFNLHDQVIQSLIEDESSNKLALFGTRYVRKRFRLRGYLSEWLFQYSDSTDSPEEIDFKKRIKIIGSLRGSMDVSTIRDADVLKIGVISTDSTEAIFLANRISEVYRQFDLAGGQGEIQSVLIFLDSQIVKYEDRLEILEDELKHFKSENQIYSLDGSAGLMLEDLTYYENIYYTNIAELEVTQERIKYLKKQLTESEQALMDEITNTNNPMIVALRGKIAELEAQKIQQMVDEGWSEESLQSRDFNRRISEMKITLTKITESLILSGWSEEDPFGASQEIFNKIVEQEVGVHAARSRANEYKKLVDQMSTRLTLLPTQTLQYARLERELSLNENLYLTMKKKYEEFRITESGQMGKVRILDPAVVAIKVKPDIKMNMLLGVIFATGFGLGYAFLREYLDNTVKAVEHLERKGLTVLGIIPDLSQQNINGGDKSKMMPSKGGTDFQRRLITYEDPKSPISESYRTLRTNITYASADKVIKSLIISSPQPGEGKSTTVANLAIAFAQLRKRVLLIDTDLRKPVQHNVFGHPRGPGIAEYLIGEITDFSTLILKTKVDNLSIVTAGGLPPNPSELLGSNRMSELVAQLEQDWDMVLFDSPPIVAVTDASMISAEIDAMVMVVKAGQTDKSAIDRAIDTLNNVKAPLVGVILNAANPETLGGKYSYYYSYYSYYHSDEQD